MALRQAQQDQDLAVAGDVHICTHGAVGQLSLNRPKAIHALTHAMCLAMSAALTGWARDDTIRVILLDHAQGRGFCSGGDINLLRTSVLEDGGVAGRNFFFDEYRLNHQLFTYPKPVIAFMDGLTMGGGVGISQPAKFRVATENTRFAMPETGIGLFPDVGGGWYLSRLPDQVGKYLALTGARLDGAECLWAGLATHYLESGSLAEAKTRIIDTPDRVENILAELSVSAPQPRLASFGGQIARHFASDRLEDVLASLSAGKEEWAARELMNLRGKSPQSCKVSLRQLAEAAACSDFAENMAAEYRIASRMLLQPDFVEGVRALIVDKTGDPQWKPTTPEAVSGELLDAIFAALPEDEEWSPL